MKPIPTLCTLAAALALPAARVQAGGAVNDGAAVGLDDLADRIGAENLPTGAGVTVGQVELANGQGSYGPDQDLSEEFSTKVFHEESGSPAGTVGHATFVARNFYGNVTSIAPGVTDVHLWDLSPWVQSGFLRTATINPPVASPPGLKIFNHSWLASFGVFGTDNNALRRADFVMTRDDVIMVEGVDNDESSSDTDDMNIPLLSHTYNGISVGVSDGTHMNDPTLLGIDGPGRMQPLIVAPGGKTSWATPVVAAAAALMVDTARSTAGLGANPNAERSEVIKAILLAGAQHRAGWTNNPQTAGPDRGVTSQPLDEVYGADLVNVNTSHLILTGGEHDGSVKPPGPGGAPPAGWDLASVGLDESRYWRLNVCGTADEASILATWHRQATSPFGNGNWAVADFDLILWRVDGHGGLVTLVGDDGLGWFAEGNVVSQSAVDNIEHLYIAGLEPGQYALELRRVDSEAAFAAWDAAIAWNVSSPPIDGDVNGDCLVNVTDLLILLGGWGPCPGPCPPGCPGDIDGDCDVDVADLLIMLSNWTV